MKKRNAKRVRSAVFGALGAIAVVVTVTAAGAVTDPYVSGSTGYDVSYPNCTAAPTGQFGIVGVNGGRPFTLNSCFAPEYSAAATTGSASAYINTAYSGAYRKNIVPACASTVPAGLGGSQAQAWEIGCSEAAYSVANDGGVSPTMWWLDVETGNSWASSNLALNRQAIQGAVSYLLTVNPNVGVYSDAAYWKAITGGNAWTPSGLVADWVASGGCPTATKNTAFTSSPVWLAQNGTSGGVDSDLAC